MILNLKMILKQMNQIMKYIEIDNNIGFERSLKYNQSEYNLGNIIRKFTELNIIRNKNICDTCNLYMKLVKKKRI